MSTVIIVLLVVDIILCTVVLLLAYLLKCRNWHDEYAIKHFQNEKELWHKKALTYKHERNLHIDRRVDLETALLWWANERMKGFSDDQYGKGKLKELIEKDKLIDISKVSE